MYGNLLNLNIFNEYESITEEVKSILSILNTCKWELNYNYKLKITGKRKSEFFIFPVLIKVVPKEDS
jgi:hypothetical protein